MELRVQWMAMLLLVACSPAKTDEALYLTELIEKGEIEQARKLSEVKPLLPGVVSYSGYFTVDKSCDSNMFFWFFPAEADWRKAPVTLWLQGGIGMPIIYGVLFEHGPIQLSEISQQLKLRDDRWTKSSSLLYIDSPVGAGFSFTTKDECYSRTHIEAANNLLEALRQFYKLFPETSQNHFYIFSEVVASKVNMNLAVLIDEQNEKGGPVINLKGIGMGNPIIDDTSITKYSEHFYNLGFIDENQRLVIEEQEKLMRQLIAANNHTAAYEIWKHIVFGSNSLFVQYSGHHNIYNFKNTEIQLTSAHGTTAAMKETGILNAIHVGDNFFHPRTLAISYFNDDNTRNLISLLEKIIEKYNVLTYDGQFSVVVTHCMTREWMHRLKWSGAEEYKMAKRNFWYVDNNLAGYWKKAGKLTQILMRDAGVLAAYDQPKWAHDMFHRFINQIAFTDKKIIKPDD